MATYSKARKCNCDIMTYNLKHLRFVFGMTQKELESLLGYADKEYTSGGMIPQYESNSGRVITPRIYLALLGLTYKYWSTLPEEKKTAKLEAYLTAIFTVKLPQFAKNMCIGGVRGVAYNDFPSIADAILTASMANRME